MAWRPTFSRSRSINLSRAPSGAHAPAPAEQALAGLTGAESWSHGGVRGCRGRLWGAQ